MLQLDFQLSSVGKPLLFTDSTPLCISTADISRVFLCVIAGRWFYEVAIEKLPW